MENGTGRSDDLFSRTWKTVAVLVGACVVFVGALSGTAVLITSKVFPDSHHSASADNEDTAKADSKPEPKSSKAASPIEKGSKKPVSI